MGEYQDEVLAHDLDPDSRSSVLVLVSRDPRLLCEGMRETRRKLQKIQRNVKQAGFIRYSSASENQYVSA